MGLVSHLGCTMRGKLRVCHGSGLLLVTLMIMFILSADYAVEERPSEIVLMQQLEEGGPDPLVFVLNANLLAMVKLVNCE